MAESRIRQSDSGGDADGDSGGDTRTGSTLRKRSATQDGNGILYEDTLVSHADPALFEAATWADAPVAPGCSGGRGATRFIVHQGQTWVLRHYYRGGFIGRVLDDQFLWTGEARTRSYREWLLLEQLAGLGLPSPRPVAARYQRRGLIYTADLITVRLPDVQPLSVRLARGPMAPEVWAGIGRCIATFHRAQVFHADLNAHNLQIDGANRIFLLDFDRGRVRTDSSDWRGANLARLHRSFIKISRPTGTANGGVQFSDREWTWLRDGYASVR